MKKRTAIAVLAIGLGLWMIKENKQVRITEYEVMSSKIPVSASGFTIVHISDFHNTLIGDNNRGLVEKIKDCQPDIIAVTGDLIDSRNTKVDVAISFIDALKEIAPLFYVSGNHESRVPEYAFLEKKLSEMGITVLNNSDIVIGAADGSIRLFGVQDPSFGKKISGETEERVMEKQLKSLPVMDEKYSVLLSHRPELYKLYTMHSYDLVLSGHAHGGQIRIPFLGGVIAPNQGFFPKFTSGMHRKDKTSMVISRGIGNSIFPLRVNNPPEIVVIKLYSEN